MKRCSTCNKTFTDRNLSFCIDDGTPLVPVIDPAADDPADEVTVVSPSASDSRSSTGPTSEAGGGAVPPSYQPPGTYAAPSQPPPKRRVWPWILGLLLLITLVLAGMGIAAWFYLRPRLGTNSNTITINTNVNRGDNANWSTDNSNSDGNTNVNENSNSANLAPAPTDEAAILADLTQLEDEWTLANIKADKRKLNEILADDYVDTAVGDTPRGKAEYLRTIEPDPTIEKWKFEDLKLSLKGDRATLSGVVRFQINSQEAPARFVDKFVWRDGRWQATGSEVTPLKEEGTAL